MAPRLIVLLAALVAAAAATTTDNLIKSDDKSEHRKSLNRDCASTYTTTCLKLDIVSWVDKLSEQDDYSVLPGVSLVREAANGSRPNTADLVAELARDFPNDPDARLDAFLMKKVTGYLNTHAIKLNLFDAKAEVTGRGKGGGGGGFGGGGGKKGDGGMGMIMMMGAMMKSTMFALAMGGLAALAGKALMTGLISLMLSAIIGLKSLSGGGKSTTYEVIAKPIYTHSNTHSVSHEEHGGGHYGHSSYGRSFDVPLPIGLQSGFKPAQ